MKPLNLGGPGNCFNCGFVLLDVVVRDGVIFREQWYTGSIFFGAAR